MLRLRLRLNLCRVVAAAAPLPVQLEPRVGGGVLVRVMLLVPFLLVVGQWWLRQPR